MKQLNFIIIIFTSAILFNSCNKEDVKPNIIKYVVESTYSGEMQINYRNEFGNSNMEYISGGNWTKSIQVGSSNNYFQVSSFQDLGLNNNINHTLKTKIYFNDQLVDENLQQGTTGLTALSDFTVQ